MELLKQLDMSAVRSPCFTAVKECTEDNCFVGGNLCAEPDTFVLPQTLAESPKCRASFGGTYAITAISDPLMQTVLPR